jgi:sugar phosphate isomerase/epimerase
MNSKSFNAVGIALGASETVRQLDRLAEKLSKLVQLGFTAAELPIQAMEVIRNGVIDEQRLSRYVQLLAQFPLAYTTHAPFQLNLFHWEDADVQAQVLRSALEVSGALMAETMVYHPGRYVAEELFLYPHLWHHFTAEQKRQLLARERDILLSIADRARELHVNIGLENMRPYPDCADYCYSVLPSALVEQVRLIDHPSIGITLDTGHLYLAHKMYGNDMMADLRAMAPHLVHIHAHDNFGKASYSVEKNQPELLALGRGDMHAPIGYGDLPFATLFAAIPDFRGILIHETRDRYEPEWSTYDARLLHTMEEVGYAVQR